ncbi:MAG: 30S ribosomal protein S20 [Candidatus Dormibacteria bacterium]
MANSRSARKRIRANERKHQRNKAVRSAVRTKVTKARRVLFSGDQVNVEEELKAAVKALDRAGEKGILHRNNVNRRKSRLTAMAARLMRVAAANDSDEAAALRAAASGGEKGRSGRAGRGAAAGRAKSTPKATVAKAASAKATTAKATGAKATTAKATRVKAKPATAKATSSGTAPAKAASASRTAGGSAKKTTTKPKAEK